MRLRLLSGFLLLLLSAPACRTASSASGVAGADAAGSGAAAAAANKLQYSEYDVLFTNPVCGPYVYARGPVVVANDGSTLKGKPKDVFCTQKDAAASADRPEAPQTKLLSWINDPAVKEIFFSYLSFSNKRVSDALCAAIKARNVKVTFEMDSTSDQTQGLTLLACLPGNGDPAFKPQMLLRGHEGGIGYAHLKMFLINPGAPTMKIAFSSGNMTSGIVLHHESWHFITLKSATYFAQAHLCVMKGLTDHHASTTDYAAFIKSCKAQIPYPEESDVKTFFVPGEGARATAILAAAVADARQIRVAAHRFGYTKLMTMLGNAAGGPTKPELQMVFDDDLWWAGHGQQTGDNEAWEYDDAVKLQGRGGKIKWMETNHAQHLLHHNKYLVLNMRSGASRPSAVFGVAGNLTGTGFTSNFENFYYVTIPAVVAAYNKQYDHVWSDLATATEKLPKDNVLPPGAN